MTISSQEIPLAAWSWLLPQRQEFLSNCLARVSLTFNQKENMEMRDEVLSSVDAQDMDTSRYQVSDLENIEFHWEDVNLNMDAFFLQGIDTPFPLHLSTIFRWDQWLKTENPFLIDEEQDMETSPPLPTTPVWRDQPIPLCWWKVVPLEQELRMFPIMLIEKCFNKFF